VNVSQLLLNALRAFEAAARNLSLTRTGLELHVTQAAVSHQVKTLEDILGAPLFRRLPRGLALTKEGGRCSQWSATRSATFPARWSGSRAGACERC
jgi:DNA-binding transcriptional LysR family regulator